MTAERSYVIYSRIRNDRDGEGVGVERQTEDCRELAQRLNLDVRDIVVHNDIGASENSSATKIRHGYANMLQQAGSGRFKTILAYSDSRLPRRVREYLELIDLFKDHGVLVHVRQT